MLNENSTLKEFILLIDELSTKAGYNVLNNVCTPILDGSQTITEVLKQIQENKKTTSWEFVTLPVNTYKELLEKQEWLEYLIAAGVDNWDGIEYAFELQEQEQDRKAG